MANALARLLPTIVAGLRSAPVAKAQSFSPVTSMGGGWMGLIRESFAGAFQRTIEIDGPRNILAFSAVFSCVTRIATDVAKLGVDLMRVGDDGILTKLTELGTHGNAAELPLLRLLQRPNHYQTWYKFIEQWVVSLLLWGNAYIFKERDRAGAIVALYVLDPQRVVPEVGDDGSVWYALSRDWLSALPMGMHVPESEIIHDTMVSLWHPLVGISPIYACGMSATMGNRIQANSTKFFENMSCPSGILTAPGNIKTEDAEQYKKEWEQNFSQRGVGRLAVLGGGMTYTPMVINPHDAQLILQLDWTVQDVARAFQMPMYKLGGQEPPRVSVESLEQTYYNDCLHGRLESCEAALKRGLDLAPDLVIKFNLRNLMRLDTAARFKANTDAVAGAWLAPNEARAVENLPPVAGGDSPMIQQQNYSLAALAKRDAQPNPFAPAAAPAPAAAANDAQAVEELAATQAASMALAVIKGLRETSYADA